MTTPGNTLTTLPPEKAATAAAPPPKAGTAQVPTTPAAPAVPKAAPKAALKKVAKPLAPAGTKTTARKATTTLVKKIPAPVVEAVTKKAAKPAKEKKAKLVRDSFTIPKEEYGVLAELKHRAGKLAMPIKKSELLRAGIKALKAMPDSAFLAALKAVPTIKTGRPAQS